MKTDTDFDALLRECKTLARDFPHGLVFIGDIAIYLHTVNTAGIKHLAEPTQDGSFYLSLVEMQDLRNTEDVTPNRRRSMSQVTRRGVDFDIYVQKNSTLAVTYADVVAHALHYDGIRVAELAHLFILKIEAYREKAGSPKSDRVARDLIRLCEVGERGKNPMSSQRVALHLSQQHLDLLAAIGVGPEFLVLAKGDAAMARSLHDTFFRFTSAVHREYEIEVSRGTKPARSAKPSPMKPRKP